MGLSIQITDRGSVDTYSLATANGWKLVGDWVDSLPKGRFPHLSHLCREGTIRGTSHLSRELQSALRQRPPKNKDVIHTVQTLLDHLGIGDNQETATVTNE